MSYDYDTRRLYATPFNLDCLGGHDFTLIITSSLTIILFVISLIVQQICTEVDLVESVGSFFAKPKACISCI